MARGWASALVDPPLDGGDLELERDLLRHEDATRVEGHVPLEPEVAPVDPPRALEAGTQGPEGVGLHPDELEGDRHGLGDVADREVAGDHVGVLLDLLDLRALEADVGPLLSVEEVGAAEVV